MAKMSLMLFAGFVVVMIQYIDASAIYTRWGRNVCGEASKVLYTGYSASGWYAHTGDGANYICMHNTPQVGSGNVPGYQANSGYLYGVEYEFNAGYTNNAPFSYANNAGGDLQNNDAPCVVCLNPTATAQIMVPNRGDCPSGMNLEYNGYLVTEWYGWHRSEYVCLDTTPEVRPGGQANDDGGLFYPVQIGCGSMPCPPNVGGNEVTCAVCTI